MRRQFNLPNGVQLRYYQENFITTAKDLIESNPEGWHLFSSPTGTGKSICILGLLSRVPQAICITPRVEIITGMLEELGEFRILNEPLDKIIVRAWEYGITTPIRLRNMLAEGKLTFRPDCLIIDESHHDLAQTYRDIDMYLNGVGKVGLTATPYRGTPQQTLEFHNRWGNQVHQLISLPDAVAEGFCSFPTAELLPLIDDDMVDVSGGEFRVKTVEGLIARRFDSIIRRCKRYFDKESRLYDRPTMITVPGQSVAKELVRVLASEGLPAVSVTQDTPRDIRVKAFDNVQTCSTILIQINVVSEGVNLKKLRRIIDLSPTMSPVKWVQQIGREMRLVEPGETPPEYICCCRNLERHGYLMDGLYPASKIAEAQNAFVDEETGQPNFSKRSGTRVVGLEGLGKFTTTAVHMLDGTVLFMYNLVHTEGFKRTEYIALVHPCYPEPVYGVKESAQKDGAMSWGKWKLVEKLPDLKGCNSAKVYQLTEKQVNRWKQSAEDFGLNPHREVNTREFQVLPFLMNTGLRFRH